MNWCFKPVVFFKIKDIYWLSWKTPRSMPGPHPHLPVLPGPFIAAHHQQVWGAIRASPPIALN